MFALSRRGMLTTAGAVALGGRGRKPALSPLRRSAFQAGTPTGGTLIEPSGDTTGVTDTANIQAALNSAVSTLANDAHGELSTVTPVVLDSGKFYTNAALSPQLGKSCILLGQGSGTIVTTVNNGFFDFQGRSALTEGVIDIGYMTIDCTGGHVFANANVHGMLKIHDLQIRVRDTTSCWFYMDDTENNPNGVTTGMYQALFENIAYWLATGTRTIEAFRAITGQNEGITDTTFRHINGPRPPGNTGDATSLDNTQHQFFLSCSPSSGSGHVSHIRWRDCDITGAYGGIIKLAAGSGIEVESITAGNTYAAPISNDLYAFTPDSKSGSPCYGVSIKNCRRGTNLGSQTGHEPPYDVFFDASCQTVLVENYLTDFNNAQGPYIDVSGCKGAVINQGANNKTAPVIANLGADTILIGQGAISIGGNKLTVP